VGVVGAGIAGLSAALHLAARGMRVTVLEAAQVGSGASGRSGAQAIFGVAASQEKLSALVGATDARRVWDMSVEALSLLRHLITAHAIDCDYVPGQMHVAIKPRQRAELAAWHRSLQEDHGYHSVSLLDTAATRQLVASERYIAGMLDTNSGHIHPLKYVRGLARAARDAGVTVHEDSRVLRYRRERGALQLVTAQGMLNCRQVVFAGNASLGNTVPQLARRIMPVSTYIVATEPLGAERAQALLPDNTAITDLNWVLDYFRRSSDHRLLFGGRASYSTLPPPNLAGTMTRRMTRVFPQLKGVKFDDVWGGYVDISLNRAPHWGRLGDNVYFAQGFSGHGVAATGLAGRVIAEAIRGQAGRLDTYAKIPHHEFPGGRALRTPLLVAAMAWFKLRDALW
jgi:gamma-glutamylputrescine oxidase